MRNEQAKVGGEESGYRRCVELGKGFDWSTRTQETDKAFHLLPLSPSS